MSALGLALRSLRNPRRSLPAVAGLALAVGLFSGILFFVDASSRTLTAQTIAPVNVDLQARVVSATADAAALRDRLAAQPSVTGAELLIAADFPTASAASGITTTTPGRLFALQPSYFTTFPHVFRIVGGSFAVDGAVVSEAMASQLGLHVGDTASVAFPERAQPFTFRVTGVVDTSGADALFSVVGDRAGEASPVANLVLVDLSRFRAELAADLQKPATPPGAPAPSSSSSTPGPAPAGSAVTLAANPEIDLRVDRAGLPADPGHALDATNLIRRRVEKQLPGDIRVVNNLADVLTAAKRDVVNGKILFIFLGIPGVLVAAVLAGYASRQLTHTQRRDFALLRARGASPRRLLAILAIQSACISVAGTAAGLGIGMAATLLTSGRAAFSGTADVVRTSMIVSAVAGLLLGALTSLAPLRAALREAVVTGRRQLARNRVPAWQRLYLDVVALGVAALVMFAVTRSGLGAAAASESTSITLSWFAVLAPLLVWLGSALILVRLARSLLRYAGERRPGGLRCLAGNTGAVAGRSLARRSSHVGAAIVVVALALAFGASISVFTSTYTARRAADTAFTLGADVKVTPSQTNQQTSAFAEQLHVPGVTGVTPVKSTTIFVGSEAQTGYGIDPPAFAAIARPPDTLFSGGTADATLRALAATPDGAIVSADLVKAYDIRVGDRITTRVLDHATKAYVDASFTAVGVASNWPSSPPAGFVVTNLDHLSRVTNDPQVDFFLASAPGDPHGTAQAIKARAGRTLSLKVEDGVTALQTEARSLATLNLSGLARLEFGFAVAVAAFGLLIFLLAGVAERARELGTLRALGASPGQLRRLLWTEHGVIGALAVTIGTATGILLARTFLAVLAGIFTAAPSHLMYPWGRLALLDTAAVAAVAVAATAAAFTLGRVRTAELLRDR